MKNLSSILLIVLLAGCGVTSNNDNNERKMDVSGTWKNGITQFTLIKSSDNHFKGSIKHYYHYYRNEFRWIHGKVTAEYNYPNLTIHISDLPPAYFDKFQCTMNTKIKRLECDIYKSGEKTGTASFHHPV